MLFDQSKSFGSDSGFAFNSALMTEVMKHQLPAEPFSQLLKSIHFSVPLSDFQAWLDHLRWLRKYDWGEFTSSQLMVPTGIINALQARAKEGHVDKWSRTVALLTMVLVTSATGYAWNEDITGKYLSQSDQNFVEAVVALMDALYHERAQKAPAGPAAFFWLAQAGVLLPSIVAQSEGPTKVYFQWLEHLLRGRPRPTAEPKAPDRVLAYLLKRIADQKGNVAHRQQQHLLSGKERLRLFFGENKNRWTGSAVLRIFILVLILVMLPLGGVLLWRSRGVVQEAQKSKAAQQASMDAARKAFQAQQAKPGP